MYIYIIELAFIWYLGFIFIKLTKNRKAFLVLASITLTLPLGLRGITVGEDTAHYIDIFNKTTYLPWKQLFTGIRSIYSVNQYGYADTLENGYLILNKFIHIFTNNAQWMLFIAALITCSAFSKFVYDNSNDVFLSTYTFMCEALYMNSFNVIRQLLAISIGINAYTMIKKKKYIKALIIVFIAFYIHNSAAVFLVLFLVDWLAKCNKYRIFKYVIIGEIVLIMGLNIIKKIILVIMPRYEAYFEGTWWSSNIHGTAVLWLIEAFMVFYILKKRFNKPNSFEIACLATFYITLELIGLQYTPVARMAWYFRAFLILLFPTFIEYLEGKNRRFVKYVIYLILTITFISYTRIDTRIYSFFWQ